MALNKQVHIYSVDTGAFYTNNERRLHWRLCTIKREKEEIKQFIKNKHYNEFLLELIENKDDLKIFLKADKNDIVFHNIELKGEYSAERYNELIPK